MARPTLRTVTRTQGNNRDLKAGLVGPRDADLEFVEVPRLVDAFRRMVREQAYDVCELAVTTYLCAKEHGAPFTALPIFLVRGFHDGAIQVRRGSGVTEPADLVDRQVGVNRGWTVTTGVWARSVLSAEYGIPLERIEWVLSGDEHVRAYEHPDNVHPAPKGRDLETMLLEGELAAVVGAELTHADIVPLIPDAQERAFRRFLDGGILPVNHLIVVRDEILRDFPNIGADLFDAFARSQQRYLERLSDGTEKVADAADVLNLRLLQAGAIGSLSYGIGPSAATLEALMVHAREQHILRDRRRLEELFDVATRDLVG